MAISEQFCKIQYLYNITSINNLESILKFGILSKNNIYKTSIDFDDVSNASVQSLRNEINVVNNIHLHDYANLYFNPRNAMMFTITHQDPKKELCILAIDKCVLDFKNTIVTNQNAAVRVGTRFMSPSEAIKTLNFNNIMQNSWNLNDPVLKDHLKKQMMAEVLVLNRIPPQYIKGIFVPNEIIKNKLIKIGIELAIKVKPYWFFNYMKGELR